MHLTKARLKQIIKEELRKVLIEKPRRASQEVPWDWQSPAALTTVPQFSEVENENPAFKDPKWWSGGFYVGPGSAAHAAASGTSLEKNVPDMTPEDWERMAARDNIQTKAGSAPSVSGPAKGYNPSSKELTNVYKHEVKNMLDRHRNRPGSWGLHKTQRRLAKLTYEYEAWDLPPSPCHGLFKLMRQCPGQSRPHTPQSKKAYDKYQNTRARIDAHEASGAGQAIAAKEVAQFEARMQREHEQNPEIMHEAHRVCAQLGMPKTPTDDQGRSQYSKCVEDMYLEAIGKVRPWDAAWAKISKVDCGTNRSMFYTAKEKRQVPNAETHPKLPFYPKKCADPQSHRFDDGYCWKTVCVDSEGRVISH
jgi:hypothetical protein